MILKNYKQMNVLEREAVRYSDEFGNTKSDFSSYKRSLSSKIYAFNRDRDKLTFLGYLRNSIQSKKSAHELICNKNPCYTSQDFETMLYTIEQEYESIQQSYHPEIESEKEFTTTERINLYNKIDEVLENLSNLKMGQEIIYDELDALRQYFNLDKKSWFQLLRGKLFDACTAGIIDKTIVSEVYNGLANEANNVSAYI